MAKSKIEWTDKVWNPVTGCTKVSPGCQNCYAERMAKRQAGRNGYPADDPFRVTLHPGRLEMPMKWTKPWRVFVDSMSDLFHPDVPDDYIHKVFDVMLEAGQHTYMLLTKRPERMEKFIRNIEDWNSSEAQHIWFGVTAENQEQADKRIPILLQIPAAVRFVSVEPMLSAVDLTMLRDQDNDIIDALGGCYYSTDGSGSYIDCDMLNLVICGGETGPGARPMHPDWARSLRDQCQAAGVPYFFKQHGEWRGCEPPGQWDSTGYKTIHAHGTHFVRLGKKSAGHLLDGQVWREMPL